MGQTTLRVKRKENSGYRPTLSPPISIWHRRPRVGFHQREVCVRASQFIVTSMMECEADCCVEIDSGKVDVVGWMQYASGARVWRTSAMIRFLSGVPLVRVFGSGCRPRVALRFTARLSQSAVSPLNAKCKMGNSDARWGMQNRQCKLKHPMNGCRHRVDRHTKT